MSDFDTVGAMDRLDRARDRVSAVRAGLEDPALNDEARRGLSLALGEARDELQEVYDEVRELAERKRGG